MDDACTSLPPETLQRAPMAPKIGSNIVTTQAATLPAHCSLFKVKDLVLSRSPSPDTEGSIVMHPRLILHMAKQNSSIAEHACSAVVTECRAVSLR